MEDEGQWPVERGMSEFSLYKSYSSKQDGVGSTRAAGLSRNSLPRACNLGRLVS